MMALLWAYERDYVSYMSSEGILTKCVWLLRLHLSFRAILWRMCSKFLYYSFTSKYFSHFFRAYKYV